MMRMKATTVREVPDDLYEAIKRLAEKEKRSLQQQALILLGRARVLDHPSWTENAALIRARLAKRELGDTVAEVRSERRR
jgi:hypothetical protein